MMMFIRFFLGSLLLLASSSDAFVVPRQSGRTTTTVGSNEHVELSILPRRHGAAAAAASTAFVVHGGRLSSSQRHRTTRLFMGWGPDPIWSSAKVVSNTPACDSESCVSIVVSVDPEVGAEYNIPGQYVQVRLNDDMEKPLFLAMSSPPTDENTAGEFEFLVKKTDNNGWLTDASSGTAIQVSQVLGGGFPMEENFEGFKYDFPTQNVLLFAAGSGIAPIKAAIESGQLTGGGRTARLYYGVRDSDELCFVNKFSDWEQNDIQVVPVLSQPEDSWAGRVGYVQAALEEDGVPIPRNSGALMCGMKGMTESVKDLLTKAGVFEGRILTNF